MKIKEAEALVDKIVEAINEDDVKHMLMAGNALAFEVLQLTSGLLKALGVPEDSEMISLQQNERKH